MPRSFFIALEGIDGSGKTTAAKLLVRALKQASRRVFLIKFPQHGQPSAWAVDQYLNGNFGDAQRLGAHCPGIFYALDRFAASSEIRNALLHGNVVLADRYVPSALAHLGGKIASSRSRADFFRWQENLEYKILGIPKPDLTIVLDVPVKIAEKLIAKKQRRMYILRGKRDAHERSKTHLANASSAYRQLARRPGYMLINCAPNGKLLSKEQVHERIRQIVEQRLQK